MKPAMNIMGSLLMGMLTVVIFYIVSCTKPGDVTLPHVEPRLVLHGYVATGDTFRVALGRTIVAQGQLATRPDTYVTNGWVLLYEGNVFLDSLKYRTSDERYVSASRIAAPGKSYTIKAGAPGYPSIEAVSFAPAPVNLTKIERKRHARKTSGGIWLDDVTFTFNDPPAERNFYLASVQPGRHGIMCVYTYDPAVERYMEDPLAIGENVCIDSDEIMYNDKTFNGTLKELTISADAFALDSFQDHTGAIYRSCLKRYHVTEDYYRYFKATDASALVLETGPGFFEPRVIKGNVKNGYGLFTIFSAATDTIP